MDEEEQLRLAIAMSLGEDVDAATLAALRARDNNERRDARVAADAAAEESDPSLRAALAKSVRAAKAAERAAEERAAWAIACASAGQTGTKVLDLGEGWDLGGDSAEDLVGLLGAPGLAGLEELRLVVPRGLRDGELALVLAVCPRSRLRKLVVAAFVDEAQCPETAAALSILVAEAPRLRSLELVVEPLIRSMTEFPSLENVEQMRLVSTFDGPSLVRLARAVARPGTRLTELSLGGLTRGERDAEVLEGVATVLEAASATLESFSLGIFPEINAGQQELVVLANALAKCRLKKFAFLSRLSSLELSAVFAPVLEAWQDTLEELLFSCRSTVLHAFGRVKKLSKLRKLFICGVRKITSRELDEIARVSFGPALTHFVVESERLRGGGGGDDDDHEDENGLVFFSSNFLKSLPQSLEFLSVFALETPSNSGALLKEAVKLPRLVHLGLNFDLINFDFEFPRTLRSLDICAQQSLDAMEHCSLAQIETVRLLVTNDHQHGRVTPADMGRLLRHCKHIAVTWSEVEEFVGALLEEVLESGNGSLPLRQLDLMEGIKGSGSSNSELDERAALFFSLLPWNCRLSLVTEIMARHIGVGFSGIAMSFLNLIAFRPYNKKREDAVDPDDVDGNTWPYMTQRAVGRHMNKEQEYAFRSFRRNREIKLSSLRECILELNKAVFRILPKDLRRMLCQMAWSIIIA